MMYQGTINIGMHVGDGTERINALQCFNALTSEGVIVSGGYNDVCIAQSDSEPTFVASVTFPDATDWFVVCAELRQEAIALLVKGEGDAFAGTLVGPKAEAWGPFDASMFFTNSGRRLSDVLPRAVPPFTLGVICDMPEGDQ